MLGFSRSEAQKAVHAAKRQQTANQTAGNVPSGHAVEVTPPTQKDNSSTGKTYQAGKTSGKALTSSGDGGIIKKKKKSKYKSKYSADEQAERSKKAKEVNFNKLMALV